MKCCSLSKCSLCQIVLRSWVLERIIQRMYYAERSKWWQFKGHERLENCFNKRTCTCDNRNARKRCETSLMLMLKTPKQSQWLNSRKKTITIKKLSWNWMKLRQQKMLQMLLTSYYMTLELSCVGASFKVSISFKFDVDWWWFYMYVSVDFWLAR